MKIKKKKIKAYMTIEASFIVPVCTMIIILTIMFLFFLYNNCVVYQDCYIAALRGSQIMDASSAEVTGKVKTYANELLDNQIYQYTVSPTVDVGMLSIKVTAPTRIDLPFANMALYNRSEASSKREASSTRIDPTEIVRAVH